MKFKIHNIIFSTSVNRHIQLNELSRKLKKSEYEPEQFPGLIYRTQEPKSGILIFSSGRINITGVKSVREARDVYRQIVGILRKNNISIKRKSNLKIENIVSSSKIADEINLDKIGFKFKNTEYEPEQFPGLIYRMDDPKLVFLIFSSGRIVCVGAKKMDEIKKGISNLTKKLNIRKKFLSNMF